MTKKLRYLTKICIDAPDIQEILNSEDTEEYLLHSIVYDSDAKLFVIFFEFIDWS